MMDEGFIIQDLLMILIMPTSIEQPEFNSARIKTIGNPRNFISESNKRILMRKYFIALFSILLVFAFSSFTQAQSADKVLKKALKAMGGEKAIKKVKSWQSKGKITRTGDGASGNYQVSAMQPNFYTGFFDVNGFETAVGYNGKSAWLRDSKDGLRTMTGTASRDFQAEVSYRNYRWLNAKNEKAKLVGGGLAIVDNKPADIVFLTTAKNVKIKMYFDQATGFLVKEEIPSGEVNGIFEYSDFRAVDGIQEPFTIRATVGTESYEIKLEQIVHNPALAQSIFEFPRIGNEPLPDINAMLADVKKNEDKIDEILEQYSYTENISRREIGKDGVMKEKESETFELSFYKGNRIRRQIEKNGKPLTGKDEENELKEFEKRVNEIEKEEAKKAAKRERELTQQKNGAPDSDKGGRVSVSDVLHASKLVNPRRERYKGRDVIVFDFEPLIGYKPQKDYEKFFGKMAGAIWVDPNDKQVVRIEARLIDSYKIAGGLLASLKKGATFVLEQQRVNDEIWLPSIAEVNLSLKVLLFKGIEANQVNTYGNYKKYLTDVDKDVKIKAPEEKKP